MLNTSTPALQTIPLRWPIQKCETNPDAPMRNVATCSFAIHGQRTCCLVNAGTKR